MKEELIIRILQLSSAKKELLIKQLTAENPIQYGQTKIATYIAGHVGKDDVARGMKTRLPGYMVPSSVVVMDQLPKLPNGKLDLQQLTELEVDTPSQSAGMAYTPPKTDIEKKLVTIWEQILNVRPISITDNFFEVGGDSILSIQIISKARKEGVAITPNQIFDHQTIGELALFLQATEPAKTEHLRSEGEQKLLPIHHWFFEEHKNAAHYWNQGYTVTIPSSITVEQIENALTALIDLHDALRLVFYMEDGKWKAHYLAQTDNKVHVYTSEGIFQNQLYELQNSTQLDSGRLLQIYLVNDTSASYPKLYIIAHHLVVDAISWQVILGDLDNLLETYPSTESHDLASRTTPVKAWADHVHHHANTENVRLELDYWEKQVQHVSAMPVDYPVVLPVLEESISTITLNLDELNTAKLLGEALKPYNSHPEELLVTALLSAFDEWTSDHGFCIGFEKHGRSSEESDVDLSESVGWLTCYYPLQFRLDQTGISDRIKYVKETMRGVPNDGSNYGALRYLSGLTDSPVIGHKPQVIFNFLGSIRAVDAHSLSSMSPLIQQMRHPQSERHHLFEVNAYTVDQQLRMSWSYSRSTHTAATMEYLTGSFISKVNELIDHCTQQDAQEFTPSDFSGSGLDQDDLNSLFEELDS